MSEYDNAVTGAPAVSEAEYLEQGYSRPDDATHFDTNYYTDRRYHKQIDGKWAYWRGDSWKVYNNQQAATVNDFIEL